jgi:hypothetical protein
LFSRRGTIQTRPTIQTRAAWRLFDSAMLLEWQ